MGYCSFNNGILQVQMSLDLTFVMNSLNLSISYRAVNTISYGREYHVHCIVQYPRVLHVSPFVTSHGRGYHKYNLCQQIASYDDSLGWLLSYHLSMIQLSGPRMLDHVACFKQIYLFFYYIAPFVSLAYQAQASIHGFPFMVGPCFGSQMGPAFWSTRVTRA